MFFYQIYDELQIVHERCANLEDQLVDNQKVTVQNRKNEEKLYQRVHRLEEENNRLLKEIKNLHDNDNSMITTLNTVIGELNYVIWILKNKEN